VYYNTETNHASEKDIEATIGQVLANGCTSGNFSSLGVVKCEVLPSITTATAEEGKTGTAAAGSANNAQITQQNQQSRSALSKAGKAMAFFSGMCITLLLGLLTFRKRRNIARTSRFCELEEAEIGEETIVGKYGLDVEDMSVFTAISRTRNHFVLDETAVGGEQILGDLKLTEDNPVFFKRGGSFNPRYITEDDGNIVVEEPFFLESYETYSPTSRGSRVNDSVTL
jgi:hypothetical protein